MTYMPPLPESTFNLDQMQQWLHQQTITADKILGTLVAVNAYSDNWDGANPADLSTSHDEAATEGWWLDSAAGTAQLSGAVYVGDELRFFNNSATDPTDAWVINRTSNDNFRIAFFDASGPTTSVRFQINDGGNILLNDAGGNLRYSIVNNGAHILYDKDGTTARLTIADDGGITLADSNGDARITIADGGDLSLRRQDGTTIFQWDQSEGELQANDGDTGQVVIFPKGTLIDMNTDVESSPTGWNTSESIEHEVVISCDYANQPVYVQLHVMVRFGNNFPANSFISIRGGVDDTAVGEEYEVETMGLSGSVSSGGDGVDIDGVSASGFGSPGTAHSHGSGTFAVNGNHGHSDTFALDSDRIAAQWTRYFQTTADGSGNLTLQCFGVIGGDATSETPEVVVIDYAVWRR